MKRIFSICIFFFLPAIVLAQDTTYEIVNDSLYQRITFSKTIGIAPTTNVDDRLLIVNVLQGANANSVDTFVYMRFFPVGILYLDQVAKVTQLTASKNKDNVAVFQIVHSQVHMRTIKNYYGFAGVGVMLLVLFFWFLYERRSYRNGTYSHSAQKTLNVLVWSTLLMIVVSWVIGFVIFRMKGETLLPHGPGSWITYMLMTYFVLGVAQFLIMAVVVQLLQNKYVVKKKDA